MDSYSISIKEGFKILKGSLTAHKMTPVHKKTPPPSLPYLQSNVNTCVPSMKHKKIND